MERVHGLHAAGARFPQRELGDSREVRHPGPDRAEKSLVEGDLGLALVECGLGKHLEAKEHARRELTVRVIQNRQRAGSLLGPTSGCCNEHTGVHER